MAVDLAKSMAPRGAHGPPKKMCSFVTPAVKDLQRAEHVVDQRGDQVVTRGLAKTIGARLAPLVD
ncbi:hypothetical protein [Streptomyces sp. NPDC001089]